MSVFWLRWCGRDWGGGEWVTGLCQGMMADKHSTPKGKMHSNCKLLPDHIVCIITQRNNIRRANTCDPALKVLNES